MGGTTGDFYTKNKSSRLGLERTGTDAVFCSDSESAFTSIEIIIHLTEITTILAKMSKNDKGEIADCVLPGFLGFSGSRLYSRDPRDSLDPVCTLGIPGIRFGLLGFPGSQSYSEDSFHS